MDSWSSRDGGRQKAGNGEYVTVEIYDQVYHLWGTERGSHPRTGGACGRKDAGRGGARPDGGFAAVAVLAALNLADELSQASGADAGQGRARAANLRGLLDEVLETEQKTGS